MANTTGPLAIDELEFIQSVPLRVLLAVARKQLDLNRLALEELAGRGYDREGVWVGFARAQEDLRSA